MSDDRCIHDMLGRDCKLLRVKRCNKCRFRTSKPIDPFPTEVRLRLNMLSAELRRRIANNYYGGREPWNENTKEEKDLD